MGRRITVYDNRSGTYEYMSRRELKEAKQIGRQMSLPSGHLSFAEEWKSVSGKWREDTKPIPTFVRSQTEISPEVNAFKTQVAKKMYGYSVSLPDDLKDLPKQFNYVLFENGIWEFVKNEIGIFAYQIDKREFPGLEKYEGTKFKMFVPKIPAQFLFQAISFFRDICDEARSLEAHLFLYWDSIRQNYFFICPLQAVTGVSVNWKLSDEQAKILKAPRYTCVLDIHSHNNMSISFSTTDDQDDVAHRIHAVVARINDLSPSIFLRTGGKDKWNLDIKIEDIFDLQEAKYSDILIPKMVYPPKWKRIIEYFIQNPFRVETRIFPSQFQSRPSESCWGGDIYWGPYDHHPHHRSGFYHQGNLFEEEPAMRSWEVNYALTKLEEDFFPIRREFITEAVEKLAKKFPRENLPVFLREICKTELEYVLKIIQEMLPKEIANPNTGETPNL